MSKIVKAMEVLVSPIKKLIDAVTGAIGKVYEPHYIRKIADAKAYEINVIGQALRGNADVPIVYDKGEISLNTVDFEEFVKRTQNRLAYQELQKQQNIENVANKAYELLEKEETCSADPVNPDWMIRFFNSVEDISDKDMQLLWAKILAGEIMKPKTFSLRTLNTLKNLSREEAELFQNIAPFVIESSGDMFLTSNTEILKKYGIHYGHIISLDDCGLILSDGMISFNLEVSENDAIYINNGTQVLKVTGVTKRKKEITFGVFSLTQAGIELFSILNIESNKDYFLDLAEHIEKNNKSKVLITLHNRKYIDNENVDYEEDVLQEFPKKAV